MNKEVTEIDELIRLLTVCAKEKADEWAVPILSTVQGKAAQALQSLQGELSDTKRDLICSEVTVKDLIKELDEAVEVMKEAETLVRAQNKIYRKALEKIAHDPQVIENSTDPKMWPHYVAQQALVDKPNKEDAPYECEHEWVSSLRPDIVKGEWCQKCGTPKPPPKNWLSSKEDMVMLKREDGSPSGVVIQKRHAPEMVLVPREPTEERIAAINWQLGPNCEGKTAGTTRAIYKAAIAEDKML